ncbi:hypothetical protein FRC04_007165 [Tulasnella sp. 424]|nr:hypothetical protein FRC04_007165 [Tulasnella sp. 424]KAG8974603.1 hypothetical protein FRC05_007079 [Tulasnella sp. 425]
MGAPKGSTIPYFNITPVGRKIEGDPKSGKPANKKGKGRNGGSNDASPGSAKPNSLLPPETGSHRGNRSRTPSVANTPTSSPQTSPETKKENLPRRSGVEGGSTDTEDRERFGKQSTTTSPHTSPLKPQPSSLQGSFPPQARKSIPQPTGEPNTTTAIQGKQENVKPAALLSFDLPTPPASPETRNQTVSVALEDGPALSLLGNPSGLADLDKQDDVKSVARPSPDPFTPPASPETRNLAVQADLENGPAASLLEPQAA